MRNLDRKLIRDLTRMKGQAFAIIMVIAAGVATFVMSLCAYESLSDGKDRFYRDNRFAEVFSSARRAARSLIPRIAEIPGVAAGAAYRTLCCITPVARLFDTEPSTTTPKIPS